jgi:chromosome segregation ATPase
LSKKIDLYLNLLSEQLETLSQMIELGAFKRKQITLNNVEELKNILAKENELLGKVQVQEEQRCQLQIELIAAAADVPDILTAARMKKYLSNHYPDKVEQFSRTIGELEDKMSALQHINAENQELLQILLLYINDLQNMLSGDGIDIYTQHGGSLRNQADNPQFRLLDKKA